MSCEKHPKTLDKYNGSLNELAEDIGNLHYETLEAFLHMISQKLRRDSSKDRLAGREKLSNELRSAAANIEYGSQGIGRAWNISKRYMQ